MARLFAERATHLVIVLLIVSAGLAFLIDLTPGDPAHAVLGPDATDAQIERVHDELGLDDPATTRYVRWLGSVTALDFGTSYVTKQPVMESIRERLPVTLEILVLALGMALAISIPVGIYTAYRSDGVFDRFWMAFTSAIVSVPPFVTALLLVFFFALMISWFPVTGWRPLEAGLLENLRYAFLPALTLALAEVPGFSRLLRADMVATLQEDYILAARARGVPTKRILLRHAFRPSSFSLITLAGLSVGRLIAGAIVVEVLFTIPGLGLYMITSIQSKDFPAVQGVVMFVAIVYVVLHLVLDLVYGSLDPRIGERRATA